MSSTLRKINILQLIDTLDVGGAEKVAVNLANALPEDKFNSFLCATRRNGPLLSYIKPSVEVFSLNRSKTFDFKAIRRLINFIKCNQIDILHAHSTSLFIAKLISLFVPSVRVIWHDHYGNHENKERSKLIYLLGTHGIQGIFAVNQNLVSWAIEKLKYDESRVWYISNFSQISKHRSPDSKLPGKKGKRIVCLANLRPQKDHLTLIKSLQIIKQSDSSAHLLLIGDTDNSGVLDLLKNEIIRMDLSENVSILGKRFDIFSILSSCDIGVLSSVSEGLPLALLEYGIARLPVVVTDVGQCREVLQNGHLGKIVPARSSNDLAKNILFFLQHKRERKKYGEQFYRHVNNVYCAEKTVKRICNIYELISRN